jgi:hypothetical protein
MLEPAEDGAAAPAAHPKVTRAVALGFRAAYDHLGFVLLSSLLWFSLASLLALGGAGLVSQVASGWSFGALLLAALGGAVCAAIGTGPLTAAIVWHTRRIVIHDDPHWWELLTAVPHFWRRGLALALVQGLVTLVLILDAGYFLAQEKAMWRPVGMLFLYPLLFWWATTLLQWPLAMERVEESLWQVIKKSALLLLDNLGYMTVLAVVVALLAALCLLTRFGLVLAWAGLLAFLQMAALRELLPKYGWLTQPTTPTKEMSACES